MHPEARIYFCAPSLTLAQSKEKIFIMPDNYKDTNSTIISSTFNLLIQYYTIKLNLIDLTALQTNFSLLPQYSQKTPFNNTHGKK